MWLDTFWTGRIRLLRNKTTEATVSKTELSEGAPKTDLHILIYHIADDFQCPNTLVTARILS